MYGVTTDRQTIKAELREWYALAEQDANREHNSYPADHTADDAAWLAALNVEADAEGPAPVEVLDEPDGSWDDPEWDRWVWELDEAEGDDAHYDAMCFERFGTTTPSGWPTDEDMAYFRS